MRMGAKKRPSYRVVVADSRAPRNGKFVDQLGYYNPLTDPATVHIDVERAVSWLHKGAQPTETARGLLRRAGVLRVYTEQKIAAKLARKTAQAAEAPEPQSEV
ncbi:MAG: 30S ribosomal protein S16 [Chloroflexota bacterium]